MSSEYQTYESMMQEMRAKVAEEMDNFAKYTMPSADELEAEVGSTSG
jgi:hypothetical protein